MPEERKAYNLRTRKHEPLAFDSDSENDFQGGICNNSFQREEGNF